MVKPVEFNSGDVIDGKDGFTPLSNPLLKAEHADTIFPSINAIRMEELGSKGGMKKGAISALESAVLPVAAVGIPPVAAFAAVSHRILSVTVILSISLR